MALRLVIAEDSYLVREGLTQLLEVDPRLEIVGVADDSHTLLEAIERERPDVVLTDIRMPPFRDQEGLEVAAQLRETHPEIGVVVLSQYSDPEFALALFESGSEGRAYLLKERVRNATEIVAALVAVDEGGSVIDPKIVDALIAERSRATDSPLAALTAREREVLAEVAAGKSNAAIASSLYLTKRAVEKHINAIFMKLNLREADSVSRRVKAALIFLADRSSAASPPAA
jgi:DNA-binding NarL/FixJ family response regulator